jgi:hypothetical protein
MMLSFTALSSVWQGLNKSTLVKFVGACCWTRLDSYNANEKLPFSGQLMTEAGKWGLKHLYGFINGWIPSILVNVQCNNDGKFLTNGGDTKNITFMSLSIQRRSKENILICQQYWHRNTPII